MDSRKEFKLKISPQAQKALDKVGVPRKRAFKPDPFQLEAVGHLDEGDVLVSAPTGSGKTWIGVKAMEQQVSAGGRTWYASPLKALSNAKYHEFQDHFGAENVGILTGDRKENASAPILVGTTEIFRNHLYDAMYTGEDLDLELMILDEAHFLGDPDRGMVWEEILIYLPSRIRLLLLSATISNAEQIAAWLRALRSNETFVVRAEERPVPLFNLFMFPDGETVPLLERGRLNRPIRAYEESLQKGRSRISLKPVPLGRVVTVLREMNLLPAIFFLKSRSDCSLAVSHCSSAPSGDQTRVRRFRKRLNELLAQMPFLQNHPQLPDLKRQMVAAHHGGQLPYWKLLVETLMKEGLLEAIFATSTVAAGVNFPARTVAFMNSDRFNGRTFENLTSTELHQMLGRAGRRGMDRIGFALVLPGPYQRPALVAELLNSDPEPIMSQMRVSFSMALNLLMSHVPQEIRELLKQSLFLFQGASNLQETQVEFESLLEGLEEELHEPRCGNIREALRMMDQQQVLRHKERYLKRRLKAERLAWFRRSHLVRGRLFLNRKRKRFCVIEPPELKDGKTFKATPVTLGTKVKRGHIKTREFEIRQIGPILDAVVDLPEDLDPETVVKRIREMAEKRFGALSIKTPLHPYFEAKVVRMQEELKDARETMKRMPCEACEHVELCHEFENEEWKTRSAQALFLMRQIDEEKERVWLDFKRHLEFLQETNFVDAYGRLTEDGLWAARLRLDQPLLIAEGIRKDALPTEDPAIMAGLVAVFVWERSADADLPQGWIAGDDQLYEAFEFLLRETAGFKESMEKNGFATPRFQYRPAATIFSWASGASWDESLYLSGLDEGDLAMIIYRTADNLRQLAGLTDSHPELSATAFRAAQSILREPVLPF
ncbi:MAG: DEAD/DEAH box helicase [Deltaproteobacteria bacterium]|nr:DEAD/DEAH box helicase [Deltaproteobacteria bacterium]